MIFLLDILSLGGNWAIEHHMGHKPCFELDFNNETPSVNKIKSMFNVEEHDFESLEMGMS